MPPTATKKQILQDFFSPGGKRALGMDDLRDARNELRRRLGAADRTTFGYIATVLRKAGYEVQYEDRFSDPLMPEPYSSRLKSALEFHDLAAAEASLRKLEVILQEYLGAGDDPGGRFVRALVKKGRFRAMSLAANSRVSVVKRLEKQEIARWFQVWLETPDLFSAWLELRKSSEEYQALFNTMNDPPE